MNARGIVTPGRFATLFHVLALTLLLAVAACESPEPPAPCSSLDGQTLTVGQAATVTAAASVTIDVSSYFSEPDVDLFGGVIRLRGRHVTATRPASSGTCR